MMEKCTPLYNQKTMHNKSNAGKLVDEAKGAEHPALHDHAEPQIKFQKNDKGINPSYSHSL